MKINRARLGKLLELLGSEHDGEVLNAARAAQKLVRDAKMTWPDVLTGPAIPSNWTTPQRPTAPTPPSQTSWYSGPIQGSHGIQPPEGIGQADFPQPIIYPPLDNWHATLIAISNGEGISRFDMVQIRSMLKTATTTAWRPNSYHAARYIVAAFQKCQLSSGQVA